MKRQYIVLFIPVLVLIAIGMLSGNVYSLGHFKDQGGPGGTVADCEICHDFAGGYYDDYTQGNLRWVRSIINGRTVKFVKFSSSDLPNPGIADGTLADGNDSLLDGACEVCHTAPTKYHRNTAPSGSHFDAVNCTVCHPHFLDDINNYFEPHFVGNQSHITHFDDPKGPQFRLHRPNDYCTYYCHSTSDFSRFKDGQPIATTTVCNPCHSKDGAFDGVDDPVIGAKPNWIDAIYKPAVAPDLWPSQLKDGKDNWCGGCHDAGTSTVQGVSAPNVMGDNSDYGYNISGHGRNPLNPIKCQDCHDLTAIHTDGNARTYSAGNNNYKSGYRLNTGMAIPRYLQYGPSAYQLCMNCHIFAEVLGPTSNFRDDNKALYLHQTHLDEVFRGMIVWDSDWNGVGCSTGACADSAMSCTACHNVHGPKCLQGGDTVVPCPTFDPDNLAKNKTPMIRHGELISTPGTTDKVPALRFNWYDATGVPTTDFNTSRTGGLLCGPPQNVAYNHVCWGCHTVGEIKYYRTPGGPETVIITNVWTTDWSNNPKTVFAPGDQIRYHVGYKVNGPNATYYVTANGNAKSTSGTSWTTTLTAKSQTVAPGTYETTWDKTVPTSASRPSNAKVTTTVKMRYVAGGTIISTVTDSATFKVQ